jgi:putative flippase GtrA
MTSFLVVGAYNALFGYVVFVGLYSWLHAQMHYNVVLAIAYVTSVTNSYLLQRRLVFRTQSRRLVEFLRFNAVNIVALYLNMGLLYLAVRFLTPNVAVAQAAALFLTIAFTYVGHTRFSFMIADDTRSEGQ